MADFALPGATRLGDSSIVVVCYQGKRLGFRRADSSCEPTRPPERMENGFVITPTTRSTPIASRLLRTVRKSRGWAVSVGLHAAVLLLLVLAVMPSGRRADSMVVLAESSQEEVTPVFTIPPPVAAEQVDVSAEALASQSVAAEVEPPAAEEVAGAVHQRFGELVVADAPGAAGRGLTGEVNGLFGRGGPGMMSAGDPQAVVEFFGVQAAGDRFVFVVDSSRSMAGRKWIRACRELIAAVERLGPRKSFYVIFFDAVAHPMFNVRRPEPAPVPASSGNVKRLKRWLRSIQFGTETRPFLAVKLGVEVEPDAVFLLSDGEFQDPTIDYLRAVNGRRRVAVHTIGFVGRAGQASLQQIAAENGGTYRFVP